MILLVPNIPMVNKTSLLALYLAKTPPSLHFKYNQHIINNNSNNNNNNYNEHIQMLLQCLCQVLYEFICASVDEVIIIIKIMLLIILILIMLEYYSQLS